MRETRESARMISCLRITLKGILPLATLAELVDAGLCPTPPAGSKAPCTQQKGLRPSRCALSPHARRWAEGQEIPCPYRDSLWSWRRYRGKGLRLRAPYPRGRCPLRYRAHPFPLHFSPKDPFIFCKGHTYRRAEPICLSDFRGDNKTGMKRKSVRAFLPIQFSFHPRQNLLVNFTRFRIASFYISTMSTTL